MRTDGHPNAPHTRTRRPVATGHPFLSEALTTLRSVDNRLGRDVGKEVSAVVSSTRGQPQLVLSEHPGRHGHAKDWIDRMVALGSRAAHHSRRAGDRQLVIVLSVPKRDFAAVLIGCGWVLASKAPALPDPLVTLKDMKPGQPLRAVNSRHVITGLFLSLDETTDPPQAQFAGSTWRVDGIRALAKLAKLDTPERELRPEPGSIEHMAHLDLTWDARLALPAADLAIIGTLKWLEQDLNAYLAKEDDTHRPSFIRSLLKPKADKAATWFTRLFSSARLADQLPLPKDLNAVILDGNGAISYLGEIETPVAICVLDRSVADETAAELVTQLRNTRGEPLSLSDDLGWHPPQGVEALAFTVAL